MASSDSGRHWVENLFPPAFGLTVDDVLATDFPSELTKADDNDDQKQGPSVFEQVAHGISPLDVSAIRNVYERVWLMTTLEEQEKQRREQQEASLMSKEARSKSGLKTRRDPNSQPKKQDANTSTTDLQVKSLININDTCIWSSQEIDVLRAVFRSAKEQNSELQTTLKLTKEDLKMLTMKHAKVNKTLEVKTRNLHEATKANDRLQIMCRNLKSQLDCTNRKISNLGMEVNKLNVERTGNEKQIHRQQVELDKERLNRRRAEMDVENRQLEAMREQKLLEERLQLDHQKEVSDLQQKIADLTQQLRQEKADHERSKKGLEHLRKHFGSLPLSGEYIAAGAVTRDQLGKWTY